MLVEKEEFEATKKAMATEEIAEDAKRDLGKIIDIIPILEVKNTDVIFFFSRSDASFSSR